MGNTQKKKPRLAKQFTSREPDTPPAKELSDKNTYGYLQNSNSNELQNPELKSTKNTNLKIQHSMSSSYASFLSAQLKEKNSNVLGITEIVTDKKNIIIYGLDFFFF